MMYQVAFGAIRGLWGRWYDQESKQETLLRARLQSVGEEGHEPVRVTLQKQGRGDSQARIPPR
jgi:hypothetical protein